MSFIRKQIDAVVYFDSSAGGGKNEFLCGYEYPLVYCIDVGNDPNTSAIIDYRYELVTPWVPLKIVSLIEVAGYDDSHITLACQAGQDVGSERVPIRIIVLIAA